MVGIQAVIMRGYLGSLIGLTLVAASASAADAPRPHELPSVYRFEAPPAGFKPATASDEDLKRYGLPARPNPFVHSTVPYAAWSRAMAGARTYVAPEIRVTGRRHVPPVHLKQTSLRAAGALTSENWAGQIIQNNATSYGQGYTEVLGQWVVSAVQQAIGTCSGTDVSSIWIGIDGTNQSSDVMQAGTEQDVTCSGGNSYTNYYAWFEWYPADEYQVTNFLVYPGAPIFMVVQATGPSSATATFVNLQSNQYTTVGFQAPAGTHLTGNCAEWIVERADVGSGPKDFGPLADYGMIWMSSEVAYLAANVGTGLYDVPGNPGAGRVSSTLTMVDSNNIPLANSYPQGGSAQDLNVSGSAY